MRKVSLIVLLLGLIIWAPAFAQEKPIEGRNLILGFNYIYGEGGSMTIGAMIENGAGLYTLAYGNVGDHNAGAVKEVFLIHVAGIQFGPVLGLKSEWQPVAMASEPGNVVNYIVGASGLAAMVKVTEKVSLVGLYERTQPLEENEYRRVTQFGANLSLKF